MTYDQWKLRSPEDELCRFVPYDEEPGRYDDCPVCNGEGEVAIYAHDGMQTDYTARCPHCIGFGRVGRES